MSKIKIFIVDDHQIVCDGIRGLLSDVEDIEVVGCASNLETLIHKIKGQTIHLTLLNIYTTNDSEIEKLVATPLERLLWQIDRVEDVYSVSGQDTAIVTVRFFVGEDRENSLVKLHNKISMNIDAAPPIVKGWVIKPVEIDDVPIVNLALHSNRYNDHELRRIQNQ